MSRNTWIITLCGAALLTALALPAARAQTIAPDNTAPAAAPPATTAPETTPATPSAPPANTTPATPVEVPQPSGPPAPQRRFRIGPAVGVYIPSSGKTRDRFGDAWYGIGLGIGPVGPIPQQGQFAFDINLLYHSRDDNQAVIVPIGATYRIPLANAKDTRVVPYAGVAVDLVPADLSSGQDNVHAGLRFGVGGSAFIGSNFGDSGYIEARYQAITSISGFDLSGLYLSGGYRF